MFKPIKFDHLFHCVFGHENANGENSLANTKQQHYVIGRNFKQFVKFTLCNTLMVIKCVC